MRLAVRLLNQALAAQARRVTASPGAQHPAALSTVVEEDIPEYLDHDDATSDERGWSGQYL